MTPRTIPCRQGCSSEQPCVVCRKRQATLDWQKNNREKKLQSVRRYHQANPEAVRATKRRQRGVKDPEVMPQLMLIQGNACAICGSDCDLGLDHDHQTGLSRGVLCRECNWGLGKLKDNPELLIRAAAYVVDPPVNRLVRQ